MKTIVTLMLNAITQKADMNVLAEKDSAAMELSVKVCTQFYTVLSQHYLYI